MMVDAGGFTFGLIAWLDLWMLTLDDFWILDLCGGLMRD